MLSQFEDDVSKVVLTAVRSATYICCEISSNDAVVVSLVPYFTLAVQARNKSSIPPSDAKQKGLVSHVLY